MFRSTIRTWAGHNLAYWPTRTNGSMRASIKKAQRAAKSVRVDRTEWHHMGEIKNERRRICQRGDGSHMSEMTNWHLNYGWHIWYHAVCLSLQRS